MGRNRCCGGRASFNGEVEGALGKSGRWVRTRVFGAEVGRDSGQDVEGSAGWAIF